MDGTILTAATAGPVASTPMGWWLTAFDALPPNITDSGGAMPNMWSGPMACNGCWLCLGFGELCIWFGKCGWNQ